MEECRTCSNLAGERPISPGPWIYEGRYWIVDHAYPTKLTGWLVLALKRHVEALHELSRQEFVELAEIQERITKLLFTELNCEKEYVACFAERSRHIHVHVIPRVHDLPDDLQGTGIFAMLTTTAGDALPREQVQAFCEDMRRKYAQALSEDFG